MNDLNQDTLERLVAIRRAEMAEVERARAAAARRDRQHWFDATMAELLRVFDTTAASSRWSGMSLDEAGHFDQWMIGELTRHWGAMQVAFRRQDRPEYRKAAAAFAEQAIEFAAGVRS
jgi:hypothetical protein